MRSWLEIVTWYWLAPGDKLTASEWIRNHLPVDLAMEGFLPEICGFRGGGRMLTWRRRDLRAQSSDFRFQI